MPQNETLSIICEKTAFPEPFLTREPRLLLDPESWPSIIAPSLLPSLRTRIVYRVWPDSPGNSCLSSSQPAPSASLSASFPRRMKPCHSRVSSLCRLTTFVSTPLLLPLANSPSSSKASARFLAHGQSNLSERRGQSSKWSRTLSTIHPT